MQHEDDLRGLEKVVQFIRAVSVLFLLLNSYWFCYGWFAARGMTHAVLDWILLSFQRTTHLFSYSVTSKFCCFILLVLGCLGTRSVRDNKVKTWHIVTAATVRVLLFFGNDFLRELPADADIRMGSYTATLFTGYLSLPAAGVWMRRRMTPRLTDDPFNDDNESFRQEERYLANEYSVNLPTRYYYHGAWQQGWINVINPFRAMMVLGTPDSGKSYAVINSYIRQCIEKGYALYIYDYKFDDLSTIAYNHLLRHQDRYAVRPQFCVINFDDSRRSNRCNPLDVRFMTDISDAYESSYVILLNLNKSWAQKEGDFFSDSAIVLLAAIIWYLKLYDGGQFCTFPHVIELLCQPYEKIFPILASYSELENYLLPFIDAWQNNAQDQLQRQIASAKIRSRASSPRNSTG